MNIHIIACLNMVAIIALSCAMALVFYAVGLDNGWGSVVALVVVGYATAAIGRLSKP